MKSEETHRLRWNELIRLDDNVAGCVISCGEGILWLTQTGNPGDHLIRAGEALMIGQSGVVLISALEDSVFSVAGAKRHSLYSARYFKQALRKMAYRVEAALREGLLT